ncbi:MAG: CapA family protein [Spirochaetota bacterium]
MMVVNHAECYIREHGVRYHFAEIESFMAQHDVVCANLETSVTDRGTEYRNKKHRFRLHPDNAAYIPELKLDVVTLGNNHMLDFGTTGMNDTIAFLGKHNIRHTGAGMSEAEARTPAVIERGVRMVFLSYCECPLQDFYASGSKPGIAEIVRKSIIADVKKHKKRNTLVFVNLHWGIEYTERPRPDQIQTARMIIDAGADAIIGHHPHIPQSVEVYRGKPVFYLLGNVIGGYYNPNCRPNMLVRCTYRGTTLQSVEIFPIEGLNQIMHCQPYLLTGKKADNAIRHFSDISSEFGTVILSKSGRGVLMLAQ